jgi:hypothetical protein
MGRGINFPSPLVGAKAFTLCGGHGMRWEIGETLDIKRAHPRLRGDERNGKNDPFMGCWRSAFAPLLALLLFAQPAAAAAAPPPPTTADALVDQMTLAEKIAQLQSGAPAIPRLHIPAYDWWSEGLHGLARNGYATVFPQAIGLGATFDPDLMRQVGDVVSTEARAKFNAAGGPGADHVRFAGLTIWSPNINIDRDPRWGRAQETYGEDPYLTGTLGDRHGQALRGPQRPRAQPPRFRCRCLAPGSGGHLFAGLSRRGDGRRGPVGDVRL